MASKTQVPTPITCWKCLQVGSALFEEDENGGRKPVFVSTGFHLDQSASGKPKIVCDLCETIQSS